MTEHAQIAPQADQKEHLMTIHQDTHTKYVLDYISQENQCTQGVGA